MIRSLSVHDRFDRRYVDWGLQQGDVVYARNWPRPIDIVDLNWALLAAAVRLSREPECIVVWPIAGLSKTPQKGQRYDGAF
jgi:hypothetical protein